ncbi:Signal peptidase I [Bertholletia excelsa]
MGMAQSFPRKFAKNFLTCGLIVLTTKDIFATVIPVRDFSMHPTLNPRMSTDDYVFVEKLCLVKYQFSKGDVVVFSSPSNYREKHIKRIVGLPGDFIGDPYSPDALRIPKGRCWVEGDNSAVCSDSRSYGPIPLGLILGRVTHVVWPPHRIGKVSRRYPSD